MRETSLVVVVVLAVASAGQAADPYPCDDASGVLALGFDKALCVNTTSGGAIGEPAAINVEATSVLVPAGETVVDVFQIYDGEFTAPPALEYTATFSWPTAVDPSSLKLREWVGNFGYDPPKALPITYVNAPDSADENKPAEFEWITDSAGLAIGAEIENRVFDALPTDVLPQIERYHWQIDGLPSGTEVTYTKVVTGGVHVDAVPEPTSFTLFGLACLGLTVLRRRYR